MLLYSCPFSRSTSPPRPAELPAAAIHLTPGPSPALSPLALRSRARGAEHWPNVVIIQEEVLNFIEYRMFSNKYKIMQKLTPLSRERSASGVSAGEGLGVRWIAGGSNPTSAVRLRGPKHYPCK